METGINQVILRGRPTDTPQAINTASGRVMAKMRFAVNRPYLGDNAPRKTDFITVIGFADVGQLMLDHIGKGARCIVLGRLEQNEYTTRKGERRDELQVVANQIDIIDWGMGRHEIEKSKLDPAPDQDLKAPREIRDSLRKHGVPIEDEDMPYL